MAGVTQKAKTFLTSCMTISCSRRTMVYGVGKFKVLTQF